MRYKKAVAGGWTIPRTRNAPDTTRQSPPANRTPNGKRPPYPDTRLPPSQLYANDWLCARDDMPKPDVFSDLDRIHPPRDVEERWSPQLMQRGWTTVSNKFLECYSSLSPSITHGEAMFIIHLMQHKWGAKAPYPSVARIARRMGISTTSVRSLTHSFKKKKYLHREGIPGRSNRYHLNRLFLSLEAFDERTVRRHDAPKRVEPGRASSPEVEAPTSGPEPVAGGGRSVIF